MSFCPACGYENRSGAKFCSECGVSLALAEAPVSQERKVITVVFVDLVGFTARAEQLDPEDVGALLSPYYARLRSELERHGGTVEKFIGDAVVALFGAPVAHEDDPERAVRAALAIRDWVREEEQLQVRIGVNSGEALVTLGARPIEGEGMAAGDVVNTAARMQSAAPANGILVGEGTYRATRPTIEYRETPAVAAKGKEQRMPVWEVVEARARLGVDVPHEAKTRLVGREGELDVLRGALARVRAERSTQLVTLVGVPGIGKSRMLFELSRLVDAEPELISWRQGRSLPYGEGVSFWALAEMVKSQAGIFETDTPVEAEAKLDAMATEVLQDETEADWARRHLRALVGLGTDAAGSVGDVRSEAFAAWRRFFEALAEGRPLVLVFEDLHWADDGLLDFVDHLVDWVSGVPLLLVCSARPELLERRPGWGGGKPNAVTLSLSPLSDEQTARLIGALLGRPVIEADRQAELLARAGGNPLYAEQYVQMLAERDAGEELPLPESIQGIVGARLDSLPVAEKRLLQDAAVIGKVFWPGAVAAMGNGVERSELEERLHWLERKQFVRRERRSSVAGETQYAFLHVVLRDVAYGQIPRAARVEGHLSAAEWIESLGRPDDHAEMLAHHYLSALELARAAGRETSDLAPAARLALADAGDRARSLNAFSASARFYREALALWPDNALEERADILFRFALAVFGADEERPEEALEVARTALLAVGDDARAAEADSLLAEIWWMKGAGDRCFEHLIRGHELVRDQPPSPGKARVLSQLTRGRMLAAQFDAAEAKEALELAESLGLDEIQAHVLITIGTGRQFAGELEGRRDIERGLEIALAGNWLNAAIRGYTNLGAFAAEGDEGLREALRLNVEAEQIARRLGSAVARRWTRGNTIPFWLELGEWENCAAAADEFLAESERLGPHYQDAGVHYSRACIRLARGDSGGAIEDQAAMLAGARRAKDPQVLLPSLGASAYLLAEAGRLDEAQLIFDELISSQVNPFNYTGHATPDLIWGAQLLDRRDEARHALASLDDRKWFRAARALLDDDFIAAAEILESVQAVRSAALARLHAAKALTQEGRPLDAGEQLRRSVAFFRSVDAIRYLREGERLLAASA